MAPCAAGRVRLPFSSAPSCRPFSPLIPARLERPRPAATLRRIAIDIDDLSFPDDLLYWVEHDVWARPGADGIATVGITALGIRLSGEIYMCRAKPVGSDIEQGRSIAVVELAKAIVSVKSAVGGRVVEVNRALDDRPELVHRDPYGAGWIARLAVRDFEADRARLLTAQQALPQLRAHARAMQSGPDAA